MLGTVMTGDVYRWLGICEQLVGPSSGVKSRSAAASVITVLKDPTAVL